MRTWFLFKMDQMELDLAVQIIESENTTPLVDFSLDSLAELGELTSEQKGTSSPVEQTESVEFSDTNSVLAECTFLESNQLDKLLGTLVTPDQCQKPLEPTVVTESETPAAPPTPELQPAPISVVSSQRHGFSIPRQPLQQQQTTERQNLLNQIFDQAGLHDRSGRNTFLYSFNHGRR